LGNEGLKSTINFFLAEVEHIATESGKNPHSRIDRWTTRPEGLSIE